MSTSRREFLKTSTVAGLLGGLAARVPASGQVSVSLTPEEAARPHHPGLPGVDYRPVVTPNGAALPWKIVNGVKVFHLVPEPVTREFAEGLEAECWATTASSTARRSRPSRATASASTSPTGCPCRRPCTGTAPVAVADQRGLVATRTHPADAPRHLVRGAWDDSRRGT
jgi:hypothetical protein